MENETSHTPGAWEIRMPEEGFCKESEDRISIGADGKHVATIHTGGIPYKPSRESVANARLIASAPELLDACELALQLIRATWPEEHGNPNVGKVWGALETAILKAKGGEA